MTYIAGVVTPIPIDAQARYADFAREMAPLFRKFGAERVSDGVGDDLPAGKINDFRTAVQATAHETVGFGWMEYADKAAYLAAGEKMRSDPRMQTPGPMPFDGKRMIFGGFEIIFDRGTPSRGGYVDGFLVPVPVANRDAYRDDAERGYPLFAEHGVRRHVEAWGDHLPRGSLTDSTAPCMPMRTRRSSSPGSNGRTRRPAMPAESVHGRRPDEALPRDAI